MRKKGKAFNNLQQSLSIGLYVVVAALLLFLFVLNPTTGILGAHLTKSFSPSVPELFTPTPIFAVTPTPIAPTASGNQTSGSNPIVACQIDQCGTVDMPQNQCSKSFCCILGGNDKLILTDHDKCTQQQQAYVSSHKTSPTSNTQTSSSTIQTVICNLSYGNYSLTQSDCDAAKQKDTENQTQYQQNVTQHTQEWQQQITKTNQENLNNCLATAQQTYQMNNGTCGKSPDPGSMANCSAGASEAYQEAQQQCHNSYGQ